MTSFLDLLKRQMRRCHEGEWSGYPEMSEEEGSSEFDHFVILGTRISSYSMRGILASQGWQRISCFCRNDDTSILKSESWQFMEPFFFREKARKWWSEWSDSMSKCASKCISIARWARMTIRISSCRDNEDISFVCSFWCGNKEVFRIFFFIVILAWRGSLWIRFHPCGCTNYPFWEWQRYTRSTMVISNTTWRRF